MTITEAIIVAIISGSFALLGVFLSSVTNRWQRREKMKEVLFRKKIDLYEDLVRKSAVVALEMVNSKGNQAAAKKAKATAEEFYIDFAKRQFLASEAVTKILSDVVTAALDDGVDIDDRINRVGSLHQKLRKTCKKELGLTALESDMAGL